MPEAVDVTVSCVLDPPWLVVLREAIDVVWLGPEVLLPPALSPELPVDAYEALDPVAEAVPEPEDDAVDEGEDAEVADDHVSTVFRNVDWPVHTDGNTGVQARAGESTHGCTEVATAATRQCAFN